MRRWLLQGVLLLLLFLRVPVSAETPLFSPGTPHASHLDYRQYFTTMSAEIGACTVSIAEMDFESEQAAILYAQIAADEAVLSSLGDMQPHTIYVVKKPLAGMQRIDTVIYCTAAQVLDGSYRSWLAEAAFGLERWQGVGLAKVAFGEDVDISALRAWYSDSAHDDMLSLFPAYFVEAFATNEERYMATQTAAALTAHIITETGWEAFLKAVPEGYVSCWLKSLGIERVYIDTYAGLLAGYTWSHNQFYPLIATSPKGDVFKLCPLTHDMSTPVQVRMALCELEIGVDAILAGVQRDAPEWYPVLVKNYAAPITYEFGDNGGYSTTYWANRRIEVGAAVSLIHETAHMMTPCKIERISRYMDQWKVEAIAEHLVLTYYPGLAEKELVWRYLQDEEILALDDPEERVYWEKSREVYLRYARMPEVSEDVDVKLYLRADVVAIQELELELRTISDVYAGSGSASLDDMNGNELSYTEAEWLASYLINRFGLSTFLRYCLDEGVSFEDAFGMPYQEAKAEWMAKRSILD